jgi:uncharacterized membrane protein
MKIFRSNRILYFTLPVIITSIILIYMAFLFRRSYTWVNVANIAIDAIILIYYLGKFTYEIRLDEKQIMISTMFKRYKMPVFQVKAALHTQFLTRIVTDNYSFYMLTSSRERSLLEGLLKEIRKRP